MPKTTNNWPFWMCMIYGQKPSIGSKTIKNRAKIYYFPEKENSLRWQKTLKLAWDRMYGIHCLLLLQKESLDEVLKVVYTMLFIVYYFPKNHFWVVCKHFVFLYTKSLVPKDYYKGIVSLLREAVMAGSIACVTAIFLKRLHQSWYQLSQCKGVWCVYLFEEPWFWRNPCEITDSSCWGEEPPLQGAAGRRGKHLDQPKKQGCLSKNPRKHLWYRQRFKQTSETCVHTDGFLEKKYPWGCQDLRRNIHCLEWT